MLWLFLLLGLFGSLFAIPFGYTFLASMSWAAGAYVLGMATGGFSNLVRIRRITFPLIDLGVFLVVAGIGFGFFGDTLNPYLAFAVLVLLYTTMVALAFHLYCKHHRLGYVEMLKTEVSYVAFWLQSANWIV
jgi:hypothetical protein